MSRINSITIFASIMSLLLSSTAFAEDFIIDTDVTATNGGEILNGDDSITVTSSASIVAFRSALSADGNDNTLTNNGSIEATARAGRALVAGGDGNTLTNTGSVSSTQFGLFADGHGNTITNSGKVFARFWGLTAYGDGNTLTNSGNVETDVFNRPGSGLNARGSGNTVLNSGTVTIVRAGYGINVEGFNNTIMNSGTVLVGGDYWTGLRVVGEANTVTNSGSVTTSGSGATGLSVAGNDNTVTNSGSISQRGGGRAVEVIGYNNAFANKGFITDDGGGGIGILASGDENALTNSGTVTVSGYGIAASGNENALTNSGTVTVRGFEGIGLRAEGADLTVTNSGSVISEQYYAVAFENFGYSPNATLNLLAGSVMQGGVYFVEPGTATLNFGPGLSAIVQTDSIDDSLPATIIAPNDQYVVDGQTIYVLDGTGVSDTAGATTQALGNVASQMLNTLDRQLSYGSMTPAVTQGTGTGAREGWVQLFGSDRSADGAAGNGNTVGLMAGADLDDTRGLFVGVARSSQTLGAGSELDSDNLFAGYYASYALDTVDVDAALTVGVVSNNSDRSVANNMVEGGLETATADYKSYYVMPAATFSGDIVVANGDLTPSVRLSYAAVHDQAYEETGSAANLDVDARTSHLFGARLQIDRGFEGRSLGEGTLMVNLRAGIDAQYAKGRDVSASLMGADFDLAASDGETTGRGFAGIDLRHISDATGLELFGSFEVGQSNDDVTDLSANIGAVFRF